MYIEEVEKILRKMGGYLKIIGVETGIKTTPYRLHGDYFIKITNVNKRQLKQAANLMSNDHHAFNQALTQHLKDFAGEMRGEYAECAIGVIDMLAELDNLYASKQCARGAGRKDTDIEAHNCHKAFDRFDSIEMHTLREVGDYLQTVGIRAGVTAPPSELHNQFIEIIDMDKSRLKQAANLMSEDSGTFTLAAAKRLKDFVGETGGAYAECAADVIAALAALDKLYATKWYGKNVAELKNATAEAYNCLKVWKTL